MTKLRQLWLLTAVASVAILAAGYFLMVSPKASKASALRAETKTQEAANAKLRSEIAQLNRQKKDLPRQQAELQKFATKIPDNPALPALIRSVSDAADNAGVELVSLSNGSPQLVGSSKPAGRTKQTAAAPTVKPLTIAAMPITVQITGNYSQVSQFLSEVEGLPRALLVSGFSITPGDSGPSAKGVPGGKAAVNSDVLTLQMTGQLYMTTKIVPAAPAAPKPATTPAVE